MRRFILYVSAQLLGAIAGACLLRLAMPPLTHPFTTLAPFAGNFKEFVLVLLYCEDRYMATIHALYKGSESSIWFSN
jgi:glycerol uptake facilitator-like aquaporin